MLRPLRDLADVHYGKSPNEVVHEDGTVPVVGTGGVYGQAIRPLFQGSAVVVPRKGSLGNPQYMSEPFWAVDTTYAVLPKKGVHARWLYYNLAQYDLTKLNEATGVPSINRDWLYRILFDDPGKTAQTRIAEILSTLDDAIDQTETLIAKTQQIKAGLMHDLFTRGVTPNGQLRPPREEAPQLYKESPLGWIPKEWDWDRAGNIASSIVPGRSKPVLDGGQFPWITIADLLGSRIGKSRDNLSVSAMSLRNATGRTVPAGAVIMSCVGEFGIAVIAECELVINQQLHGFVPNNRVLPVWLMHALRTQKPFLERIATQTTIKCLNKSGCESVSIPLPNLNEQDTIVESLTSAEYAIESQASTLAKLTDTKSGLMHDLLTGRVRVPIAEGETAHD